MSGMLIAGLLVFVLGIWMAIKVGRESVLMGIVVFFIPPIGLIYMIKNWGTDNDLRVPAILWALTLGWYIYSVKNTVEQLTEGMDPEMMAALERGEELTPEQQAQLDRNVAGMLGVDPDEFDADEDIDPLVFNQAAMKIGSINRQRGTVVLPEAKARLEVPTHFRFLEGGAIRAALAGTDAEFVPGFLGWVVHETLDFSKPEQWSDTIEVIATTDGHVNADGLAGIDEHTLLARGKAAAARIAAVDAEGQYHSGFAGYQVAPLIDNARHSIAWVSVHEYADGESAFNCEAIRLGRKTQVTYRLPSIEGNQHELCLRQVRLLANSTAFIAGEDYPDVRMLDGKSRSDLAARVTDEDLAEQLD